MESINTISPADLIAIEAAALNLLHMIARAKEPQTKKECRNAELQRTKAQLLNRKKIKS